MRWRSCNGHSTRPSGGWLVVEDGRSVTDELHQGCRTFELGVFDKVVRVELPFVEADRAHVEPAALLDELIVDALHRRVLVLTDRSDVSAHRQSHALRRE